MARIAVGTRRNCGIIRELLAAAFLRNFFAVLPVAQIFAVGGPLDRLEIDFFDAIGHILARHLAGIRRARLLGFVLVEAIESRLTTCGKRCLEHLRGARVDFRVRRRAGAARHQECRCNDQKGKGNGGLHRGFRQRLMAGASKAAPLALRARNIVNAMDPSDANSSAGNRCCRKQSKSRHWNVRNSPCETR